MCKFCEIGVHHYENENAYQKGYQTIQSATITTVVHLNLYNIGVTQMNIKYCPMCGKKLDNT